MKKNKKVQKKINDQNTKIIEIESELNEKKNIKELENNIKELEKNKSLINKYEKEIQYLKKIINEDEEFFNNEEKNRIKKDQEIQELKKKLNDKDVTREIKSNDDITYLETGEKAAEGIADFHEKKRKGYADLPILLSKLNINSSKELISNIEQLINNLYNNKQITKQVYNILNKAITYKNDS